jgi:hypothetical protein
MSRREAGGTGAQDHDMHRIAGGYVHGFFHHVARCIRSRATVL